MVCGLFRVLNPRARGFALIPALAAVACPPSRRRPPRRRLLFFRVCRAVTAAGGAQRRQLSPARHIVADLQPQCNSSRPSSPANPKLTSRKERHSATHPNPTHRDRRQS